MSMLRVISPSVERSTDSNARRLLSRILLKYAETNSAKQLRLSQREIASILNTSWDMVNSLLKSLQCDGAILIDRHRIVANRMVLERIAGI